MLRPAGAAEIVRPDPWHPAHERGPRRTRRTAEN